MTALKTPRAIVVGAGIGGLSSALMLAHAGMSVRVCEAGDAIGGKLRQVQFPGHDGIDCGPTVFTMRWLIDDFLETLGVSLDDLLSLQPINLLARHSWPDGSTLDLFADLERSVDEISRLSGSEEGQRYLAFRQQAKRAYDALETTFMRASRPSPPGLVLRMARRNPSDVFAISPFRTLWDELGRYFRDPRLQQLFGRYATYCGSSPFAAPATLMLVAHAESRGVWLIDGGMKQLASAFGHLASRFGVEISCNAAVSQILVSGGRTTGVRLADGETLSADVVVYNGDVNALPDYLMHASTRARAMRTPHHQRSQSAVTWTLVGEANNYDLAPHTVFFSSDYAREFEDVFRHGRLPREPTVYVHAPDRPVDGAPSATRNERLFVLVNAPANGDLNDDNREELERCQESMLRLTNSCGLSLRWPPQHVVCTTPRDFNQRFPGTGGALYGQVSHGWKASFRRPSNRTSITGLYLAGGSVHPGPGIPMALSSGRLAAECILKDFRLLHRSHRVGTIGGISTALAKTANSASQ
ncbi:MAG: 1-hydroxycarotenoid 3,4-desaturase CrtD [Pseudomonadota bacterium]